MMGALRADPGTAMREFIARVQVPRSTTRLIGLLVLATLIFSVLAPRVFLSPVNIQNIGLSTPEIGIISLAMMVAMLTGGIDLSLISIANVTAISISTFYSAIALSQPSVAESWGWTLVVVGITIGALAGLVNGVLIAVVGITPILATLATMQVFNGLAIVWTGGKTLYGAPVVLTAIGRSTVGGVPSLFVIFVALALLVGLLLSWTPLGLALGFEGSNPTAAKFSGLQSSRTLMATYVITGALAGVAGTIFLARNPTASADYGLSYLLLAIVIVVLGGTNPFGGYATVTGVVLAAVTLQAVASGFTALRRSAYDYSIAQGVILLAILIIDQVRWQRRRRPRAPAAAPV